MRITRLSGLGRSYPCARPHDCAPMLTRPDPPCAPIFAATCDARLHATLSLCHRSVIQSSSFHTLIAAQGSVGRPGEYVVNLLHYEDAASLAAAVRARKLVGSWKGAGRTLGEARRELRGVKGRRLRLRRGRGDGPVPVLSQRPLLRGTHPCWRDGHMRCRAAWRESPGCQTGCAHALLAGAARRRRGAVSRPRLYRLRQPSRDLCQHDRGAAQPHARVPYTATTTRTV
jgi:hypothetical protein